MVHDGLRLSELFTSKRFPRGLPLFLLIFYFPFGFLLVLVRLCFALQLILVLSVLPKTAFIRRLLLRVSSFIIGLVVTYESFENYSQNKQKVIASNHVSFFDNCALEIILPSIMCDSMSPSPWLINKLLGYTDFGGSKEKENLNTRIKEAMAVSDVPLLVFPEESTTNGQKGLLKFNPWCFELYSSISPIAIEVKRLPYPAISQFVLGSSWCAELFWFLFLPFTNYHLSFLPCILRSEYQTVEDFSLSVQKAIAIALGVQPTNFTAQDKAEYIKKLQKKQEVQKAPNTPQARLAPHPNMTPTPSPSSPSRETRLAKMAHNVKEVLPQVPLEAILKDLRKTKCVDATIANILEGKVPYQPEVPGQNPSTSKTQTLNPPKSSHSAAKFSRSPEERHRSFEERKKAMMEDARNRYIAKHAL